MFQGSLENADRFKSQDPRPKIPDMVSNSLMHSKDTDMSEISMVEAHQTDKKSNRNSLINLLCGNRNNNNNNNNYNNININNNINNNNKSKTSMEIPIPMVKPELKNNNVFESGSCSSIEDLDTNINKSIASRKSSGIEQEIDLIEESNKIMQLEKQMFSKGEPVSVKDFFARKKQESIVIPSEPEIPVAKAYNNMEEPILIEDELSIEDKIYRDRQIKTTSAKDFLGKFKPTKKEKDLKKETKKFKNCSSSSMLLTFKINADKLKEIQNKVENPLFVKGFTNINSNKNDGLNTNKKSSINAFQSMMANAKSNSFKLTPLQKLKVLQPPIIPKNQLHVQPEINSIHQPHIPLAPRVRKAIQKFNLDSNYEYVSNATEHKEPKIIITKLDTIPSCVPKINQKPCVSRIYHDFVETGITDNHDLWTHHFRPLKTQDLLLEDQVKDKIHNWIINAFNRLKSQALALPRNELLKQQKKKKNLINHHDDFIVPDNYMDESETEEEIFLPVLIIQGAQGVGKSASVYAAMEEINGYVYEINSGQARSRRDLYGTLKEFCTTQLVHQKSTKNNFQKGIVLFEDTDILFEQDKTFWTVVQDMINISRRPIVITCNNMSTIPKSILQHAQDDDGIISIDFKATTENKQDLLDYLWWCCYSKQYVVEKDVLEMIIDSRSSTTFDLRRALISLQVICQSSIRGWKKVSFERKLDNTIDQTQSLNEYMAKLDLLSNADIIETNSKSHIEVSEFKNEILDTYIIDECLHLRRETLPYELNIGKMISKFTNHSCITPNEKMSHNTMRNRIITFVASRSKKLSKLALEVNASFSNRITRSSTMSEIDPVLCGSSFSSTTSEEWKPDVTGIPDASICKYLSRTQFLVELAPHVRNWARFQLSLDQVEKESLLKNGVSVKKFLAWRQFQTEPQLALTTMV